jgi:hypothetical protein
LEMTWRKFSIMLQTWLTYQRPVHSRMFKKNCVKTCTNST